MRTWGLGPTWLNEGMSVYAAGTWQGRDLHSRARELRDRNELAPLDRLTHDFRALDPRISTRRPVASYASCASTTIQPHFTLSGLAMTPNSRAWLGSTSRRLTNSGEIRFAKPEGVQNGIRHSHS
jgi:hypothetical protein